MGDRFEDNETLKRAFALADTGRYGDIAEIEKQLIEEKRLRVSQLLSDLWTRERLEDRCYKAQRQRSWNVSVSSKP